MNNIYDLVGIGIGPFNLSLAALLQPNERLKIKFCDNKSAFKWHPELLFDNAPMQTSYLKDLVTPVQPTNPYSFMNYLVQNGQFYHFLNTSRNAITRFEFEDYLKWCCNKLDDVLDFDSKVLNVEKKEDYFKVTKKDGEYLANNLCIASGPIQNIPKPAERYLGKDVFHAKSSNMLELNVTGKRVLVVGGGQTGVETFRNILKDKWGKAQNITMITGRENLIPLDEGPFTNEVFSPNFVSGFYDLPQERKDEFTKSLLIASDGNTPTYLQEFYNELYFNEFYKKEFSPYSIQPMRWLEDIKKIDKTFVTTLRNKLSQEMEDLNVDIIILATGFTSKLPSFLENIKDDIILDEYMRPKIARDYRIETKYERNQIYAMNYSRHGHGIADPQTSLMSWRSAIIANSLLNKNEFKNVNQETSFIKYFSQGSHND